MEPNEMTNNTQVGRIQNVRFVISPLLHSIHVTRDEHSLALRFFTFLKQNKDLLNAEFYTSFSKNDSGWTPCF